MVDPTRKSLAAARRSANLRFLVLHAMFDEGTKGAKGTKGTETVAPGILALVKSKEKIVCCGQSKAIVWKRRGHRQGICDEKHGSCLRAL